MCKSRKWTHMSTGLPRMLERSWLCKLGYIDCISSDFDATLIVAILMWITPLIEYLYCMLLTQVEGNLARSQDITQLQQQMEQGKVIHLKLQWVYLCVRPLNKHSNYVSYWNKSWEIYQICHSNLTLLSALHNYSQLLSLSLFNLANHYSYNNNILQLHNQ